VIEIQHEPSLHQINGGSHSKRGLHSSEFKAHQPSAQGIADISLFPRNGKSNLVQRSMSLYENSFWHSPEFLTHKPSGHLNENV
jgi:hypothetical protein